jgi:hypothetical protein
MESRLDPIVRLLELYERSRKILDTHDLPSKRLFSDIQLEIDRLRIRHPLITEKLESQYRRAHPGEVITARRLVVFAYEQNLLLTGEPYPKKKKKAQSS